MSLNIRDLACMSEFSLELKSLGTVRCLSLTTDRFSQASKKLASSGVQSLDFVRWLFGDAARHTVDGLTNEDDTNNGVSLTPEELSSVTNEELEGFAEKLIQKYRYFLKTHKGSDIERSADESTCNFLFRAFRHHAAEQKAQWNRMTKSVTEPIFARATMEAMQLNRGLSDQLRDTIDKYACGHSGIEQVFAAEKEKLKRMALVSNSPSSIATVEAMQRDLGLSNQFQDTIDKLKPDLSITGLNLANPKPELLNTRMPNFNIPKNPIHDTNKKLESVVKQMEGLRPMATQAAQLIRSMNDTALRMQADYIENAKATGRQTKIAICIAAVSLFVSAVSLALSSYFRTRATLSQRCQKCKATHRLKHFKARFVS